MKVLKQLHGAHTSRVELVEVDGVRRVLKTGDREEIANERFFLDTLREHGLPSIHHFNQEGLEPNQLLLEFFEDVLHLRDLENPEHFEKWGRAVRKMHDVTFAEPFRIDENGTHIPLEWHRFLQHDVQGGVQRQLQKKSDLPVAMQEKIVKRVHAMPNKRITASLLHCDLHDGNAFVTKDGSLVLFDKGSALAAGDPLYDLALIALGYAGTHLAIPLRKDQPENDHLMAAFMTGYGKDFIAEDPELFDSYVLLRAIGRYPNPFEMNMKETIEQVLAKYE